MDKLQAHYQQIADEEYPECEGCKKLRAALEKIAKLVPPDYKEYCEYWEWDNREDIYNYGIDRAFNKTANIAKEALREGE